MITNSIVMSIYCYFSKSLRTNDVNFHFLVREIILVVEVVLVVIIGVIGQESLGLIFNFFQ